MNAIKKLLWVLVLFSIVVPFYAQSAGVEEDLALISVYNLLLRGSTPLVQPPDSYSLGGTVSGLAGTLEINQNGTDNLTISINGSFTFPAPVAAGESYNVTVTSAPDRYSCIVSNGSGIMPANDVNTIDITCSSAPEYNLGGTVTGLTTVLEISQNGSDNLTITENDSFTFLTPVTFTHNYLVEIVSTPSGYDCEITNGSGTMPDHDVNNVTIVCAVDTTPPLAPVPVYPSDERKSNWINYNPLWKWVSGGGGNGTYRYEINVNCLTVDLAATGTLIQDTQVTVLPKLEDGTHSMCIQERDDAGNWSATASIFYYIETVAPVVTGTDPQDGATGIKLQPVIAFTFSEYLPWDPDERGNYVTLHDSSGNQIFGDTGSSDSDGIWKFIPNKYPGSQIIHGKLQENEFYTVTITTLFKDNYGNTLETPYSFQFTTRDTRGYYSNGENWNDYIKNDGADIFSANNIPCDGTETGLYDDACIHGGEMRVFTIPGVSSCTSLTAEDYLNAFNWQCMEDAGVVRFVSTGLKEEARMPILINGYGWNDNAIIVADNSVEIYRSQSEQWWNNKVKSVFGDGEAQWFMDEGTIYRVYSSVPGSSFVARAPKIAIVADTSSPILADVSAIHGFHWVEGDFRGSVDLGGNFSVIRKSSMIDTGTRNYLTAGLNISGTGNLIQNVDVTLCTIGVWMKDTQYNTIINSTVTNNSYVGIRLDNADNNNFDTLMLTNNFQGTELRRSGNNLFKNITATHNVRHGMNLNTSSSDNIIINLTAAYNGKSGVNLEAPANNNLFSNVAAINNAVYGINITGTEGNTFQNLAVTDNGPSSDLIIDQPPTYGLLLDNASVSFTGSLITGRNGNGVADDCEVINSSTGIDTDCAAIGTSDHTLFSGQSALASFVGKALSDDSNTSDSNAVAAFPSSSTMIDFDWTTFDNTMRSWGGSMYATHTVPGTVLMGLTNVGKFGCNTHIYAIYTAPACNSWGDPWHNLGHIWDWNLKSTDTLLRDILVAQLNGEAANTIVHKWTNNSTSVALRNAIEITGNGDGLCASDETCLYTPNIGSYQGHGELQSAGSFIDGSSISGVTLLEKLSNGQ